MFFSQGVFFFFARCFFFSQGILCFARDFVFFLVKGFFKVFFSSYGVFFQRVVSFKSFFFQSGVFFCHRFFFRAFFVKVFLSSVFSKVAFFQGFFERFLRQEKFNFKKREDFKKKSFLDKGFWVNFL